MGPLGVPFYDVRYFKDFPEVFMIGILSRFTCLMDLFNFHVDPELVPNPENGLSKLEGKTVFSYEICTQIVISPNIAKHILFRN